MKKSATNGYMHESYFQDSVDSYTRPWFAWTNSLFGDMLIDLMQRHPDYILRVYCVSFERIISWIIDLIGFCSLIMGNGVL